jgi:uncharacterized HAD superfamily protein
MLMKDGYMQTVYVDMDDVLCETAQHFLTILKRDFGKKFAFEQLTDFDVGDACELTVEEREELYRIVHYGEELLSIPPIPGAVDVLQQWSAAGYGIAIVTGRPPDTYEPSAQWLKKHRVPHDRIFIVDKYGRFAPDGSRCISEESRLLLGGGRLADNGDVFGISDEDSRCVAGSPVEPKRHES